MKKITRIVIVIAAAVIGFLAAALGMRMCGGNESSIEMNWDDRADYYGCPNSRRVKKLNLAKSKRIL